MAKNNDLPNDTIANVGWSTSEPMSEGQLKVARDQLDSYMARHHPETTYKIIRVLTANGTSEAFCVVPTNG